MSPSAISVPGGTAERRVLSSTLEDEDEESEKKWRALRKNGPFVMFVKSFVGLLRGGCIFDGCIFLFDSSFCLHRDVLSDAFF